MIHITYRRHGRFRWIAETQRDNGGVYSSAPKFTKAAAARWLIDWLGGFA